MSLKVEVFERTFERASEIAPTGGLTSDLILGLAETSAKPGLSYVTQCLMHRTDYQSLLSSQQLGIPGMPQGNPVEKVRWLEGPTGRIELFLCWKQAPGTLTFIRWVDSDARDLIPALKRDAAVLALKISDLEALP